MSADDWKYFDSRTRERRDIPEEAKVEARALVEAGFIQTSVKYRGVGRFEEKTFKELEKRELSPAVFAAFRKIAAINREFRAHRKREEKRNRARFAVEIIHALPDERAEEFIIDLMMGVGCPEYGYAREVGLWPEIGSEGRPDRYQEAERKVSG